MMVGKSDRQKLDQMSRASSLWWDGSLCYASWCSALSRTQHLSVGSCQACKTNSSQGRSEDQVDVIVQNEVFTL